MGIMEILMLISEADIIHFVLLASLILTKNKTRNVVL